MEEQKEDFLTPEERASLAPKEIDNASIITNNISEPGNRPTFITVLCGYFFISWILTLINIIVVLTSFQQNQTLSFSFTGFPAQGWLGIILSLIYIISIFGYWLMKKWGVYLFAVLVVLLVVINFFTVKTINFSFIAALILPIVVIWAGFKYLDRMA